MRLVPLVCLLLVCLLAATCAGPPLTLYTLGTPPAASEAPRLGKAPIVIAITRVTIPDELDTADVVVRDGSALRRSSLGRWASRLSLGITDRVTERLGQRYPGVLVTDRPLTETPAVRVLINIGRLDVSAAGVATLDADWLVVPRESRRPSRRERMQVSVSGPVATDQDVVTLMGNLVDRLAGAIDLSGYR
jgi:uncharacterized protein